VPTNDARLSPGGVVPELPPLEPPPLDPAPLLPPARPPELLLPLRNKLPSGHTLKPSTVKHPMLLPPLLDEPLEAPLVDPPDDVLTLLEEPLLGTDPLEPLASPVV